MSALDRLFAVHKSLDQASQVAVSAGAAVAVCPPLVTVVTATFAQEVAWNPLIQQIGRKTSLSIWRALRLLHKHGLLPVKILDSVGVDVLGSDLDNIDEEALQEKSRAQLMTQVSSVVLPQVSHLTEPLHPNMLLESSVALSLAISLGWPLLPQESETATSGGMLAAVPAAMLSSSSTSLSSSTMGLERAKLDPMGSLMGAILDPRPVSGTSSSSSSSSSSNEPSFNRRSRGAVLYQRLRGDINAYLLKTPVLPGVIEHLLSSSSPSSSSSLPPPTSSVTKKHPIEGGLMVFHELASQVLVSGPSATITTTNDNDTGGSNTVTGGGSTVGPREFLNAAMPHVGALAPPPLDASSATTSVAKLRTLLDCCQQVCGYCVVFLSHSQIRILLSSLAG